ncbi:MAG: hypothetical protein R3E32_16280 [Chitinophagales bacterium]
MNRCLVYFMLCLFPLLTYAQAHSRILTSSSIAEPCFVTSYLSHQHLMAFQHRALQKAEDVEEYLKIVRNYKYDKILREQAAKMLLAFFVKDAEITFESDTLIRQISVQDFVQELLERDQNSIVPSPKTIKNKRLESSLALQKSGYYVGMIAYNMIDKEDPDFTSERIITVHLQKVGKIFGEIEEDVWEVKLGNVVVR